METKKETMTIRPGKEYAGIIKRVEDAAKLKKWSLNKFVLETLNSALKKKK